MGLLKLLFCTFLVFFLGGSIAIAQSSTQEKANSNFLPSSPVVKRMGQILIMLHHSDELCKNGDSLAQKGDWKEATIAYQDALTVWKDNHEALYGLANCCHASGDTDGELKYDRAAIYSSNPVDKGYRENNPKRLIAFVFLLSKLGQSAEALSVYQHTITLLNQPSKVPLPTFGSAPGQLPYTPERLQAMSHLALAIACSSFDPQDSLPQIPEAILLAPNSAVAYFYLGDYYGRSSDRKMMQQAKAAYLKAIQLDSNLVGAPAREQIKRLDYWIGS